jgi:hypothetical protein
MTPIALLNAEAGSTPSGTGSFTYFTNFRVLVENLAFTKLVGVWAHDQLSGNWSFFPCTFSRFVPNNNEIWQSHVPDIQIDQFDLVYQVSGNTFWDSNAGFNYHLDTNAAHTDGIGSAVVTPNVLTVESRIDPSGNLSVQVLVKNLAFAKQVAIVYSIDNWATFHNVFGNFRQLFPPPTMPHQIQCELWSVSASLPSGVSGQFAVFYSAAGTTYWDNNFGLNYAF